MAEPIRDPEIIKKIKENLRSHPRDYALFVVGINVGLRITDLLSLNVKDVWKNGKVVEKITVYIKKSRKKQTIILNKPAREAIKYYMENRGKYYADDPLFVSFSDRRLEKTGVWRLIRKWVMEVGLDPKHYGTHSLRKTWGYHARQQGVPIELIQEKLGHRSPWVTKKYIGIVQEEVEAVERGVEI